MQHRRLTRAGLAAETGISKPTVGESVRRLTEAGLVADTGERTLGGRGRGRVGSYYALADVGVAVALSIAPEGIVAECLDALGDTVSRAEQDIGRPAHPDQVAAALRAAVIRAHKGSGGTPRLAVVSAADPVDRSTGRLIQLPDAPFLLGELDPVEVLAPYVEGPVTVDNDVNWAARAERDGAPPGSLRDFAYVYLDDGVGCAIVSDAEVRRGSSGLAGEVAHLITAGPQGQAMRLIDVFGELGLRRARLDGDRRRPPAHRGQRRPAAGGGRPPDAGPGHQRGSRRRGGTVRPGTHRHRRLVGRPSAHSRRDHHGLHPAAPACRRPRSQAGGRVATGRSQDRCA